METIHKIGRRKTAVARIYVSEGKGNITVNKKDYKDYFTTATLQYKIMQALNLTDNANTFDIKVNVYGGGVTGQAEAIRLAISRALVELNAENRAILKPEGLLTRDPRMVERKKFGQKKARKKIPILKTLIVILNYFANFIGSSLKLKLNKLSLNQSMTVKSLASK
jgi:small subunit ribosomal protein S9